MSTSLLAYDMRLIRRDVFYRNVTLTERTELHVSAHNNLLSTRLYRLMEKKIKKEKKQVFVIDVRYSRGCPNEKNNYYYYFFLKDDGSAT